MASQSEKLRRRSGARKRTQGATSARCLTHTSTDGTGSTATTGASIGTPCGALSKSQTIALIQQGRWWPFDRVDPAILKEMHLRAVRGNKTIDQTEDALW